MCLFGDCKCGNYVLLFYKQNEKPEPLCYQLTYEKNNKYIFIYLYIDFLIHCSRNCTLNFYFFYDLTLHVLLPFLFFLKLNFTVSVILFKFIVFYVFIYLC